MFEKDFLIKLRKKSNNLLLKTQIVLCELHALLQRMSTKMRVRLYKNLSRVPVLYFDLKDQKKMIIILSRVNS